MKKLFFVLGTFIILTACSSSPVLDKPALKRVKKVGVVGYTFDYRLRMSDALTSALMGGERNLPGAQMGGKIENKIVETPVSAQAYDSVVKALQKGPWQVVTLDQQASSTITKLNQGAFKTGYFPLQNGYERYEKQGSPQYHHVGALLARDKQNIATICQEMGVDAIVLVYLSTKLGNSFSLGPIGLGSYKYSASIMVDIFDAHKKEAVGKFVLNGEGMKEEKLSKSDDENYNKNLMRGVVQVNSQLGELLNSL